MRWFSPWNVWRMRQLYEAYSSPDFLPQAVAELGAPPKGVLREDFLAQAERERAAAVLPFLLFTEISINLSNLD